MGDTQLWCGVKRGPSVPRFAMSLQLLQQSPASSFSLPAAAAPAQTSQWALFRVAGNGAAVGSAFTHTFIPPWEQGHLWGFGCFSAPLRLEAGAQPRVCWESCSDLLLSLFAEKLMFKNAPTPQEFKEGDDAVIVCDVVSSLPPTIIWKHKGRDVILKKDGKAFILFHSGVKCPSPSHTKCWWSQGAGGAVCAWDVNLVIQVLWFASGRAVMSH